MSGDQLPMNVRRRFRFRKHRTWLIAEHRWECDACGRPSPWITRTRSLGQIAFPGIFGFTEIHNFAPACGFIYSYHDPALVSIERGGGLFFPLQEPCGTLGENGGPFGIVSGLLWGPPFFPDLAAMNIIRGSSSPPAESR